MHKHINPKWQTTEKTRSRKHAMKRAKSLKVILFKEGCARKFADRVWKITVISSSSDLSQSAVERITHCNLIVVSPLLVNLMKDQVSKVFQLLALE